MATRENPDAIKVDVSEINTSGTSNTEMTDTDKHLPEDGGIYHLEKGRRPKEHRGHKSHLTMTQNAADRAVTPGNHKEHERCLDAYYTKADTMELAYEHLLIVDLDDAARWEREVNEVHETREVMKEKWLPIIAKASSPLSQPLRRDGPELQGKIKIRADLKPRELSKDSSPVEFSTWCEEYTIYHSASNLQLASKREQQINLYSHIDEDICQTGHCPRLLPARPGRRIIASNYVPTAPGEVQIHKGAHGPQRLLR